MKVLLSKPYKGKNGKWFEAGDTIDLAAKEAKRLGDKGGCVQVVTPEPEPTFATPFDAIKDAIDKGEVTGDNAPTVDALSSRLKRKVSAEERDELFAAYSAE